MNLAIIIAFSIVFVLLIACIIFLILHIIKFRKYVNKYNTIWNKFENENIEKDIEMLIENMEETKRLSNEAKILSESIEWKMLKSIQKVGFVKYDAYEQGNNELSFSLAMLNGNDDGVIINSIYTRNGSNIYAKRIENGIFEGSLSDEEDKALQIAKNSKTFM